MGCVPQHICGQRATLQSFSPPNFTGAMGIEIRPVHHTPLLCEPSQQHPLSDQEAKSRASCPCVDRGKERSWQKAEGEKSRRPSVAATPEVTIILFPPLPPAQEALVFPPIHTAPPTPHSEYSLPPRVLPPTQSAPSHSECSHIGDQRDCVGRKNQDILEGLYTGQKCDICLTDGRGSEALGKLRSREEEERGVNESRELWVEDSNRGL